MNRNPDTVKEVADRRKLRQKANKARGSADPSQPASTGTGSPQGERVSGATASGSQHPAEPHNLLVGRQNLAKVVKEASPPRTKTKATANG